MEASATPPDSGVPDIPVAGEIPFAETPPPLPARAAFPRPPVRAPLSAEASAKIRERHEREEREGRHLKILLRAFGAMMAVNVVLYWCVSPGDDRAGAADGKTHGIALLVAEVFGAAVIATTWWKMRRDASPVMLTPVRDVRRVAAYTLAALAGLLLLNYGYHAALRGIFGIHRESVLHAGDDFGFAFTVLTGCVLPAFFEELFFRKLCHDFFLTFTGSWVAAIASAVMFASAHTFGLVSFPYLVVFGLVAARLRMRTGSLVAPMAMHFLHNLAISLHDLIGN